jgi:uncharacterized membrane protein
MDRPRVLSPEPADPESPQRHSGRAALLAMLAVGFLIIGVTLVAMLQSPGPHAMVVASGAVLIVGGLALLPIAWRGRHGRS